MSAPAWLVPARRRRRGARRWALVGGLVTLFVLTMAGAAAAHPLGNFTVNTASVLRVQPDRVRVDVVVDFAEIPATQLRPEVDAAGPRAWQERACARVAGQVTLALDRRLATLHSTGGALTFPPGQGGLSLMRLVCRFSTAPVAGAAGVPATDIEYATTAYTDRSGWRETVAVGDRTTLTRTDVPTHSPSALLTAYPVDPLAGRSEATHASLLARPGGSAAADPLPDVPDDGRAAVAVGDPTVSRPGTGGLTARFTGLVHPGTTLTIGAAVLALVTAVGLGAAHAFAPGHGKTMMAAMIVGRSATRRQLAAMAGAVTLTHTAGVFLLAVALSASKGLAPVRLYPWIGAASGLLMIVLGIGILRSRLARGPARRAVSLLRAGLGEDHRHDHGHPPARSHHHGHGPDHDRGPDDEPTEREPDHGREPRRGPGRTPSHVTAAARQVGAARAAIMVLDHAGGHDHPPDDHGHDDSSHSDHGHLDHSHGDHGHGHERHRDPPHGHRHGGRWHSHAPLPAVDGNRPRLRTLLLTGLAGGMVPTPSAVVVLLGAMTLGRASFGILLVIAYGLGMAATLVGVGYLLDRSLRPLLRRLHRTAPRLSSTVLLVGPVVSALAVVGAGSFLVLRAGLPLLGVT